MKLEVDVPDGEYCYKFSNEKGSIVCKYLSPSKDFQYCTLHRVDVYCESRRVIKPSGFCRNDSLSKPKYSNTVFGGIAFGCDEVVNNEKLDTCKIKVFNQRGDNIPIRDVTLEYAVKPFETPYGIKLGNRNTYIKFSTINPSFCVGDYFFVLLINLKTTLKSFKVISLMANDGICEYEAIKIPSLSDTMPECSRVPLV